MEFNWTQYLELIKNNKKTASIFSILLAMIIGAVFLMKNNHSNNQETLKISTNVVSQTRESISSKKLKLNVDIKGAVVSPGVYQMSENDLVDNAIKKANGATEEADLNKINLAQKVMDQMVIYVPKINEEINNNFDVISNNQIQDTSKVNLNKANSEELQMITGVGEKKAELIINYRNEHGSFQSVDDLKNINGFGDKTVDNIRDQVVV